MEHYNGLLAFIAADGSLWFMRSGTKQEILNAGVGVDVHRSRDVASIILIIEAAIDNVIVDDLLLVRTI